MSLSFVFLLFVAYSFIGWVSEVAYCSVIERRFVNRGFLGGPLCPVYGFGGLLVIFLLEPFSGNVFYLFAMAIVVTSFLEYVTGWALETIFRTKWWDYSHYKFNIHGRVCLLNSLLFGGMSVVAVRLVHPAIVSALARVPPAGQSVAAAALAAVIGVDLALTLKTLVALREKIAGLAAFVENFRESVDVREWFNEHDLSGSLARIRARASLDSSEATQRLLARFETLLFRSSGMARIVRAFPSIDRRIARKKTDSLNARRSGDALDYFLEFFAASFVGVLMESAWCLATTGAFESRTGLLYGMLNPLYGLGAALMTLALSRLGKRRELTVLLLAAIIGGAFQFLCGFAQERLFGSISWDYAGSLANVGGRTNLLVSLLWGVSGLLWVRDARPILLGFGDRLRGRVGKSIFVVLAVAVALNCAVSALAVRRWADRKGGVPAENAVTRFFDARYGDSFMEKIYPNMKFR